MTLQASPSVVTREIAGEIMLLDLDSGTYFGLDPIGAAIWQAIERGLDLGSVIERIEAEYDVAPDQLQSDVNALLAALRDNRLTADGD